mmetsp:Transcript_78884/g.96444  ORF Transcript_78884/g.96444 Transcript_78884/m.96444 type:complete len:93 (+) Transcript_78884:556-834(+)
MSVSGPTQLEAFRCEIFVSSKPPFEAVAPSTGGSFMQTSSSWLQPSNEAWGLLNDSVPTQLPGAKSDAALKTFFRFAVHPLTSAMQWDDIAT